MLCKTHPKKARIDLTVQCHVQAAIGVTLTAKHTCVQGLITDPTKYNNNVLFQLKYYQC